MSEESYEQHWCDFGPGSEHANRKAKETLRSAANKMTSGDIEERLGRNLSDRITLQHEVDTLLQHIAALTAERDRAIDQTVRLFTEIGTLTAERDALRAEVGRLSRIVDGHELISMRYEEATRERDALRAKIDGSFVTNCYIKPRAEDDPLFNGVGYVARLNGYAIVDRHEYDTLRTALKQVAEALLRMTCYGECCADKPSIQRNKKALALPVVQEALGRRLEGKDE